MTRSNGLTIPVTVRILRTQIDALKVKFPTLTIGALIRSLLSLYLDGAIPSAYELTLREMDRVEEAQKSGTGQKVVA